MLQVRFEMLAWKLAAAGGAERPLPNGAKYHKIAATTLPSPHETRGVPTYRVNGREISGG